MTERVGVLALQGAFRAHIDACTELGVDAVEVRTAAHLDGCTRLIIPGGESTTMSMMLDRNDLREPLAERIDAGMPVFGTCAGMILLASEVSDGRDDQRSFDAIDIAVRRNGYGRQNQSFSDAISLADVDGGDAAFHAVFIRAPRVERIGDDVEVLARYDDEAVLCRQGPVLVAAFHPELSPDRRLHRYFCSLS